jgi:hypothetical protein
MAQGPTLRLNPARHRRAARVIGAEMLAPTAPVLTEATHA